MKKAILIILDGWGIGPKNKSNAILAARTPFFDSLISTYPHSQLLTSGEHVGLPDGQMGNSEVGHLNIGAGRVVYQDLGLINKAIREKSIDKNNELLETFEYVKKNKKKLHFIGLVSDGGIHSHQEHLYRLCELAAAHQVTELFVHAFTDGRDCDPRSGMGQIAALESRLQKSVGRIASVCGRYYAMDRDKRWDRVKMAYDMMVQGEGKKCREALQGIKESYEAGVTDEFVKPIVVTDESSNPLAKIEEGDAVICFNFRTDRCREITQVLTQKDMPEQGMKTIPLHYVTMTNYDDSFAHIHILFHKDNLAMTLGEVLEKNHRTQIRIAETEKYPHVTFFFSGGREKPFEGEKRIMIPSPKVATYDLKPTMSAVEVKDAIVKEILHPEKNKETDFICLNFANPDMVGHTGVYSAVIEAVECIDTCLKEVVQAGLQKNYSFVIIADHGNADYLINEDGTPNTAHTTNPVPCIVIDSEYKKIDNGKLSDIAPTILRLMHLEQPVEMNGKVLV